MKIEELRQAIAIADNPDWFNTIQYTLSLNHLKYNQTFKGIPALYLFVINQLNGWNSFSNEEKGYFTLSINFFEEMRSSLISLVNQYTNSSDQNRNSFWSDRIINRLSRSLSTVFLFNVPEVEFLLKIKREYPEAYDGAYEFILGNVNSNIFQNKGRFMGTILAYEFTLKDYSRIVERRNAEKSSISKIRTDFERYWSDNELFMYSFREDLKNRLLGFEQDYSLLKTSKTNEFDSLATDKANAFEDWLNKSSKEYAIFYGQSESKIKELETTYQEKLKLEEPALYWSKRARELKIQGWWALGILILLILIGSIFLAILLWKSPDSILVSWFEKDKSSAIRWTLVFFTLLSILAYGIRSVNKFMFSSFHLARDCEERHTLTYFYLSLLKDSNVNEKDRQLIMQSLFSRSETGLLKEDSSPTMPGISGVIGNALGK